jgi:pilus assembly protein CpaF
MSTIHANGPKDALSRIETCALFSGIDLPLHALRDQVASAVNVVVHTARLSDGSRRISNVSEVVGLAEGEYQVQDLLTYRVEGTNANGGLVGRHIMTDVVPTFADEARIQGMTIDRDDPDQ